MTARIAVLAIALTCACGRAPDPPPQPLVLTVGVHRVAVTAPPGWLHLDHGGEHRFHRGTAQISIADVGPILREGYLREIDRARELFRDGRASDARALLGALPVRRRFSSERQWREFGDWWFTARDGGLTDSVDVRDVEPAYSAVIALVAALPDTSLRDAVDLVLPDLDHGPQRDIAATRPSDVDGRPALHVETWDRLSHDHRRDYLFVLNAGNLLVLRNELGSFAELHPAFDALSASLAIDD